MSISSPQQPAPLVEKTSSQRSLPYIWVHVVIAGLVMVATLPGRTFGLGLITEPLMRDLNIGQMDYAVINTWATLFGAIFCLPCGWLLDRFGPRPVLFVVALAFAVVVIAMSKIQADWWIATFSLPWLSTSITVAMGLFILVLLTRGLGQSALSVISLALMGKSTGRNVGISYGVYSVVISVGFMAAFVVCTEILKTSQVGWRLMWGSMGFALVLLAFTLPWLVRSSLLIQKGPGETPTDRQNVDRESVTLGQALRTRTFWVFALGTSFYGAVTSAIALFNEGILGERGFDKRIFYSVTIISPLIGLAGNLVTGWLATQFRLGRLLAISMVVMAAAMACYPILTKVTEVYFYAVTLGLAGGMITVLFFGVWSKSFGPLHLGKIQGLAQMLTVVASAFGPLIISWSKTFYGSYVPCFEVMAVIFGVFGISAWFTPDQLRGTGKSSNPAID